jgi:hypothetical protein
VFVNSAHARQSLAHKSRITCRTRGHRPWHREALGPTRLLACDSAVLVFTAVGTTAWRSLLVSRTGLVEGRTCPSQPERANCGFIYILGQENVVSVSYCRGRRQCVCKGMRWYGIIVRYECWRMWEETSWHTLMNYLNMSLQGVGERAILQNLYFSCRLSNPVPPCESEMRYRRADPLRAFGSYVTTISLTDLMCWNWRGTF